MEKEFILNEIRRCADENGGIPLGRERFLAVTGMSEKQIVGAHWARWNDAVAEAGFEPNSLNGAHSDGYLLDQLAMLMSSLGRFPTFAEMRLQRRSDRAFPDGKTFGRFGTRRELVLKLRQHCVQSDLTGVAAICDGTLEHLPIEGNATGVREQAEGYVYLFKMGMYFKLGRSNDPDRRRREVATNQPKVVDEVHRILTDDPEGIEDYWHRRFASKRAKGEWFELAASDVKAFKKRKFM